ncbi:Response regulator receiver protein [Pseudocitrobacter vendiensis]|uniref:Response regulator receiver protein n=1 Tax=Pseudocitrobacter vendiensis TaxID=2488306 RepID=A0ABN8T9Q5_9ENTR|nr:Response regulator receiver protein [Pseudocitrobacter vendiensis]
MPLQKYELVRCISCHYRCELTAQPTVKMMNCVENQYCIWPNDNTYLQIGIRTLLINTYYTLTHTGLIFVDFSRYKINLFTNSKWIEHLKKTGLRIILVSDKQMQPLASYWKKNYQQIVSIIGATDSHEEVKRKIRTSFLGRRDMSISRNQLTDLEIHVLDLFISEYTVRQIAAILNITNKKVYATKQSLKNKMGGRGILNSIISG